ncbi:hypothetical protein AVEN_131702-1 [Araneus ventricosus]|uniref:Uncharacterized protein n=1 Tax=Araneus ventricosus TaxID=182803 RepID=A0A4Y2D7P9_ARAVE|nr:hypothetical protein AVEN_131702-1 [Araneus ventricosus]
MSKGSQIRQNYHEESEAGVNKQINMELYASYVYAAMSKAHQKQAAGSCLRLPISTNKGECVYISDLYRADRGSKSYEIWHKHTLEGGNVHLGALF